LSRDEDIQMTKNYLINTQLVKLGRVREEERDRIERGRGDGNIIFHVFVHEIVREKYLKSREIYYDNCPGTKTYHRQKIIS
jgi:hypothetical protein